MHQFTVVGLYPDTEQVFCDHVLARNVNHATSLALGNNPGLTVVTAFYGKLTPASTNDTILS